MKRRLLLMALATTMVATMFTGCGSSKDENTTKPATNVEQGESNNDSNVNDSNKEDATSKVEEVKGYDEVFYDEPDWAVEYEGEDEYYIEEKKREYAAMKWVFEDMTQNFKHKKEVTATEKINVNMALGGVYDKLTFVCDIDNVMVEGLTNSDGEPIVWKKDLYPEFAGFNAKKTEITSWINDPNIRVSLVANLVDGGYPIRLTIYVTPNEDGTYTYKSITVGSSFYK